LVAPELTSAFRSYFSKRAKGRVSGRLISIRARSGPGAGPAPRSHAHRSCGS
jgi:hypothetical protein